MQVLLSNIIKPSSFKLWLSKTPWATVFCMSLSAFVIYSCMYGFRKPYTVATYANLYFLGISYKVCLVVTQVIGYMISKFIGIKFISAMQPSKRAYFIVLFIGLAWLSLLGFAVIPAPYNIICMFLNGLPLGMVFGLVFGFLEGRRTTEIMGVFLATSFIFASGLAKSVGKWLLVQCHISDWWMPFAAGGFFVLPLLIAVWLIQQSPPPSDDDIRHRTERKPMTKEERLAFIKTFGWAMVPVVIAYAVFTIVRDFCEDFANELWIETGYQNNASIFAQTSTNVSLIVLAIVGGFFLIKSNYTAFVATHYIIIIGVVLSAVVTLLYSANIISPVIWMLLGTTGMYLAYIPYNCLYFERLLSTYKIRANVGFVMYIADAFGYLGTVLVLLIKEFMPIKYNWVSFFSFLFYAASIIGVILIVASLIIHHQLSKTMSSRYEK
jgi:MFS family permease